MRFVNDIIEGREQLAPGVNYSLRSCNRQKWEDARSNFIQIARAIEVSNVLGKGSDSKSVSVTDRREVMERVVKELNDVLDKMEDDNQEDDNNKYIRSLKAKRAVESRGLEPNSVLINGVYYDMKRVEGQLVLLFLARWDISLALSSKVFRKLFKRNS